MAIKNNEKELETDGKGCVEIMKALSIGSAASVLMQEADGQRQLCASNQLPHSISEDHEKAFVAMGFVFGEDTKGDELFRAGKLPEGWILSPCKHSMYTDVLDGQGRKRAMVFYKAASYDRRADMQGLSRYYVQVIYNDDQTKRWHIVFDRQTGDGIHKTLETDADDYSKYNVTADLCYIWLEDNHPDHRNPAAYWDK